ncbi:hypothetical protein ES703_10661 [subsurface metagenome]
MDAGGTGVDNNESWWGIPCSFDNVSGRKSVCGRVNEIDRKTILVKNSGSIGQPEGGELFLSRNQWCSKSAQRDK